MVDEQIPQQAHFHSHRRAWAAGIAAFLVHNVEEVASDLPAWAVAHPVLLWLGWMAPAGWFAIAVGVLTLGVGGLALYAMSTAPRWSGWALVAFAVVMLANAASHIVLSVMTSSVMPGVVTAGLVIAPVFAGVLWAVLRRAPRADGAG
jgi:hypothetical protein